MELAGKLPCEYHRKGVVLFRRKVLLRAAICLYPADRVMAGVIGE
jgi:hypothetical protein